jgi:VIT1/CCC1 family predicted Fe2+/Mn2+ transporter
MAHKEVHRSQRSGWLRASVLGANDGTVSTASLLLGVAASHADRSAILLAGSAALVAGAMAMAAGEYVSVKSQADVEHADLSIEQQALDDDPEEELRELTDIYIKRGLEPGLAREVARQLMAHDALNAHARDELGITETLRARPFQAAMASGAAFVVGGVVPLITVFAVTGESLPYTLGGVSLVFLALLGGIAARAGGANVLIGAVRVLLWGAAAMALTAAVGALFGRSA